MNDTSYCGNEGALIAFLYDECEPAEREAIAAHVARCAACADEIESLRLTRTQLAAWTPPAAALGFRMTRESEEVTAAPPAAVLTSPPAVSERSESNPRWWTQPLPAWAQMAAAALIFATGIMLGASRAPALSERSEPNGPALSGRSESNGPVPAQRAEPAAATPAVSRDDFDQLRAEVSRLRDVSTATPVVASVDEDALLRRVQTLVDQRVGESEERQRRDFTLLTSRLARDFETVRRQDLFSMQEAMGRVEGVTAWQLRQQSDLIRRVTLTQPAVLGR